MTELPAFPTLPFNCYELLHLAATATPVEVTKQYRALLGKQFEAKKSHEATANQERFKRQLWFAYLILSDPGRRAAYDQFLKG